LLSAHSRQRVRHTRRPCKHVRCTHSLKREEERKG
jgi:hypothetical protein